MKIKLSKKAKIASTIALVAAAAGVGFLLDNINRDEFVIENVPDDFGGIQADVEALPTEDTTIVDGKVNINTADALVLEQLDGIGASTAEKIIEYREINGKFETVDDLVKVSGIGEKKLDELRDSICVQ